MNRTHICAILGSLFALASAAIASETVDPHALEPCINGQVSASGLYPTQAEEDAALALLRQLDTTMGRQVSASER